MTKPAEGSTKGELSRPFEPFYSNRLPVGTPCDIINEDEDRYIVKFPGVVGYSGSFHIKKSSVNVS